MYPFRAVLLLINLIAPIYASLPLSAPQEKARKDLGQRHPQARLLWVRDGSIFHSRLEPWIPRRLTDGDAAETRPRWSEDGQSILFQAGERHIYLLRSDTRELRLVSDSAHTADWIAGEDAVTGISTDGHRVFRFDLRTGKKTVLYDSREESYNGQALSQAAELRRGGRFLLTFRLEPAHVTEVVDLFAKRYLTNSEMRRGDCSPAWAPDGTHLILTARTTSRPVLRAGFDPMGLAVTQSLPWVELPGDHRFYIHNQRYTWDGRHIVLGGKYLEGPDAAGKREIYFWSVGTPPDSVIRITFDRAEDEFPSLYLNSADALDEGLVTLTGALEPKPDTDPYIRITHPAEGSLHSSSTLLPITWESESVETMLIEHTCDSGLTWALEERMVELEDEDWGQYSWKAPDVESPNCYLRLSEYFGEVIVVQGPFSLTSGPARTLRSPVGALRNTWQPAWATYRIDGRSEPQAWPGMR